MYDIIMPGTFTVSADLFAEHTGEVSTGDVCLVRNGTQWLWVGSESSGTVTHSEVQDMYVEHMCDAIGVCGVHVAADNAWAAHKGIYILHFGAYGDTHVLAFGIFDDALEDAAAVLPPGMFVDLQMEAARKEMYAAGDLSEEEYLDRDSDDVSDKVYEHATVDLTQTESGHLRSWEWTYTEFESLAEALTWARG